MGNNLDTFTAPAKYTIIKSGFEPGFLIEGPNSLLLRDKKGRVRIFKTRNTARKRISRERRGSFHK